MRRSALEAEDAARAQVEANVSVDRTATESVYLIESGVETISIPVSFDGEFPERGISYRVSRDDEPGDNLSESQQRLRRFEGLQNEVVVDVGRASPGHDSPTASTVRIITAAGDLSVVLQPAFGASGAFGGEVSVPEFGSVGLPLEFEILTEPEGATFEGADAVYLRLPTSSQAIFSPVSASTESGSIIRPLVYESAVDAWVAKFEFAFELGANSLLSQPWSDQVGRSMRIELKPDDKSTLRGRLIDRWKGLYEERNSEGIKQLATISFTGDIEARRIDGFSAPDAIVEDAFAPANPRPLPAPPINECETTPAPFAACDGIDSPRDFARADVQLQAECAIAASRQTLSTESLGDKIASFIEGESSTSGSFEQFMQDCESQSGGACDVSPDVLCARQLTAAAYRNQERTSSFLDELMEEYQRTTREAVLGRQLRAFGADSRLRLEWLQTTETPDFLASAVQNHTEGLLEEWKAQVLDAHIAALRMQFDSSGLIVLSRTPQTTQASDARRQLLAEMAQSWQGTMLAVETAAQRWHLALDTAETRDQKAGELSSLVRDLYLMAGTLKQLNLAASAGYLNAGFATGFRKALDALDTLRMPYEELVFARDAEVVLQTSLDPQENQSVLQGRESEAMSSITLAEVSVDKVLEEAHAQALDREQLRQRMGNEIDEVKRQLINLCGLPKGCSPSNLGSPECEFLVEPGRCGFVVEDGEVKRFEPGQENASQAGQTLLAAIDAAKNVEIAESELQGQIERTRLALEELDAFAHDIEEWNLLRMDGVATTAEHLERIAEMRRDDIDALETSLEQKERRREQGIQERMELRQQQAEIQYEGLEDAEERLASEKEIRDALVQQGQKNIEKWNTMKVDGIERSYQELLDEQQKRQSARELRDRVASTNDATRALASGLPSSLTDASSVARFALYSGAAVLNDRSRDSARKSSKQADAIRAARTRKDQLLGAELNFARDQARIDREVEMNKIQELRAEADLDRQERGIDLTELKSEEQLNQERTAADLAAMENDSRVDQAERQAMINELQDRARLDDMRRQAHLAYQRDLAQFRAKQSAYLQMLTHNAGLEMRVSRARFNVHQAFREYDALVVRAKVLAGKLTTLERQRERIEEIIGSPEAIFRRANQLARAEAAVDHARSSMMQWLVALEYYAVRPFLDHRISILLASSPHQLREIARELRQIQSRCGGITNRQTVEMSVRRDFLGFSESVIDPVTDEELAPADRFREVLGQTYIPTSKRIRYRTDATVGDLLASEDGVLTVTFDIDLSDFTNLASVCNAKLASVGIELVGDIGQGHPTVGMLYDGTGRVRSCQPHIEELVQSIGAESTAFGEVTYFRTEGRSISPVAGINSLPAETDRNRSLIGLPLASQYTLFIDQTLGDNAALDWDKLEDVVLSIEYAYQDVFAEGQCY